MSQVQAAKPLAPNPAPAALALYRAAFLPALLLLGPRYLARMWRRGGYGRDWTHRLGRIAPVPPRRPGVRRLWLQAVSVGELLAAESLLRSIAAEPGWECVLTTTTSTGYALARERLAPLCAAVGYFPLDFWPCSRAAWRRIQPDLCLLMESELWPEHLHQARRRGVPVLLANARLSDRSFRRYQEWPRARALLFDPLRLILASTAQDEDRLRQLAGGGRVRFAGNLKCDFAVEPRLNAAERQALRTELGFTPGDAGEPFVLLGSSTWPGEEEALLAAAQSVRARGRDCRLLLVPRHAERRRQLEALLATRGNSFHLRSQERQAPAGTLTYLADTTGELRTLSQVADLVFVGKSLPPNEGGQTPIEAAALGLPILFGPAMSNFRDVARGLCEVEGALPVTDARDLVETVVALCGDPARRAALGRQAAAWHAANQGALDRTLAALREVLAEVPARERG